MKESTKLNISIAIGTLVSGIIGVLCLKKLPSDRDVNYSETLSSFKHAKKNIKSFSLAFVVESLTVSLATIAGVTGFFTTKYALDRISPVTKQQRYSSSNMSSFPPELGNDETPSPEWSLKINDHRRLEKQSKIGISPDV